MPRALGRTAIRGGLVLVIDSLRPYGGQRVALDLAAALQRTSHVTLVTFTGNARDSSAFVPPGVDHLHIGSTGGRTRRRVAAVWRLWRSLVQNRPSAVIGFMPYANALAAFCGSLARVPVVVTEHTITSRAQYRSTLQRRFIQSVMRLYLRRVAGVVGVSRAVSQDLIDVFGAPPDRVITIYNPLDRERLVSSAHSGESSVPKATPSHEVRLLIVGMLKAVKGHDCALRALAILPDQYVLYLVGDGPLWETLHERACELGIAERVKFVGWQQDAAAWMRFAEIVWVPSLTEGFGLALVEARALGRKVLATSTPGLAEIAGLLGCETVAPGDWHALAAATIKLAATPFPNEAPTWLNELTPRAVGDRYLAALHRFTGR